MDFIIGIFVGALLFYLFVDRKKPSGTFVIDLSNPEKDIFQMQLEDSLDRIYEKKQIVFKVKRIEPQE